LAVGSTLAREFWCVTPKIKGTGKRLVTHRCVSSNKEVDLHRRGGREKVRHVGGVKQLGGHPPFTRKTRGKNNL